jgi:hypothetical protein
VLFRSARLLKYEVIGRKRRASRGAGGLPLKAGEGVARLVPWLAQVDLPEPEPAAPPPAAKPEPKKGEPAAAAAKLEAKKGKTPAAAKPEKAVQLSLTDTKPTPAAKKPAAKPAAKPAPRRRK